jgi:hypothetical protein
MTNQTGPHTVLQQGFAKLPLELFLTVLDQLVGTRNGQQQPVAYEPSGIVTKTLRALTLVSRSTYLIATKYLYSHCLYLDSCTTYARFRRTLGLHLGHHPQALDYGEAGRNDELFAEAQVLRNITSLFVSPSKVQRLIEGNYTPLVRLSQIIDLCDLIGPTLRRLALDLSPIYATPTEIEQIRPHVTENNVFILPTPTTQLETAGYHCSGAHGCGGSFLPQDTVTTNAGHDATRQSGSQGHRYYIYSIQWQKLGHCSS